SRRQIRYLREVKLPLRIQRVVYLPASVPRLPHRGAHLAQLLFRFSQQFHASFRYSPVLLSSTESPSRISCFSTSLLLYIIASSFQRYNFPTMQKQLAVEQLAIADWVKGLAAIPERDFSLENVQ